MSREIFRPEALRRLSSPEQLDQVLRVTSIKGWLALLGVALVLAAAGAWGYFGSIPTYVSGRGILVRTGGVHEVFSSRAGTIKTLYFKPGDIVQKGQVAARLDLPEVEDGIREIRDLLEILRARQADAAQRALSGSSQGTDLNEIHERLQTAERKLAELTEELAANSKVRSNYSGRVIEVGVEEGGLATAGAPIMKIELMGSDIKNLEALLYFPASTGKKVRQGMRVLVAPSTVRPEEYGYAYGMVTYVSDYPATRGSMLRSLKNEGLVEEMSRGTSPIEVRADLIPDPRTPSGYKWSSGSGPPSAVRTGTLCSADVRIDVQRPIDLAFPFLQGGQR